MKCEECGKRFDTGDFCPVCGKKLFKEKVKFSKITIISLITLILVIVFFAGLIVYSIKQGTASDNNVYGWLFIVSLMSAFIIIPYYAIIFVASDICDHKVKKIIQLKILF